MSGYIIILPIVYVWVWRCQCNIVFKYTLNTLYIWYICHRNIMVTPHIFRHNLRAHPMNIRVRPPPLCIFVYANQNPRSTLIVLPHPRIYFRASPPPPRSPSWSPLPPLSPRSLAPPPPRSLVFSPHPADISSVNNPPPPPRPLFVPLPFILVFDPPPPPINVRVCPPPDPGSLFDIAPPRDRFSSPNITFPIGR